MSWDIKEIIADYFI